MEIPSQHAGRRWPKLLLRLYKQYMIRRASLCVGRWPNRGPFGRIGALFRIDSIAHIAHHRYVTQPTTKQQPDCKISERQQARHRVDARNKRRRYKEGAFSDQHATQHIPNIEFGLGEFTASLQDYRLLQHVFQM